MTQASLSEIIEKRIEASGAIPFRDFMEMALYYPGFGYYSSGKPRIGLTGDYYTAPCVSPLFGEILAGQLEEIWVLMGRGKFDIVEFGGGDGTLARDILCHAEKNDAFYSQLRYIIVEKRRPLRSKDTTPHSGKIHFCESVQQAGPLEGCILSNELLDNLPVHRVQMLDELMEIYVDFQDGAGFVERLKPASPELQLYFEELGISLTKGFQTEVCLDALRWLYEVAANLQRGFVITIDYGFSAAELYSQKRSHGNVVCYHQHELNDSPYVWVGEQDITAHVNFSALNHWGEKYGLGDCGFTNQAGFLRSLGFVSRLRQLEAGQQATELSQGRDKSHFLHRMLTTMGDRFKILVQQKGIGQCRLSGLQFATRLH